MIPFYFIFLFNTLFSFRLCFSFSVSSVEFYYTVFKNVHVYIINILRFRGTSIPALKFMIFCERKMNDQKLILLLDKRVS